MQRSATLPSLASTLLLASMLVACAETRPGEDHGDGKARADLSAYCTIPAEPPAASAGQAEFSEYAWKLFVALNWPAKAGERGVPSCSDPIGSAGPTVWQSYRTTDEIFLDGARDPGAWNAGAGAAPTLRHIAKSPSELPVENAIQQAVGGWLIDQAGHPTYYQIAVDRTSYEYVRSNRFYDADVVNQASRIAFPDGSLEVKASWRVMDGVDASRYLTTTAEIMTFDASGQPTGNYETRQIGLVGLHAVYKAPGFPQWIWTTFEHEDNAPDSPSAGGTWSYFDAGCTGAYCTPNSSPLASGQPFGSPNQVTRITATRAATATSNAKWRGKLHGTPYAHYQLISPQWPADPDDPGNPQGSPTPGTVANVTMETYIQPTSSCMDCHSTARVQSSRVKSNYSFIFLFAKRPG